MRPHSPPSSVHSAARSSTASTAPRSRRRRTIAADVLVGRPDGVAFLLTPSTIPGRRSRELLAAHLAPLTPAVVRCSTDRGSDTRAVARQPDRRDRLDVLDPGNGANAASSPSTESGMPPRSPGCRRPLPTCPLWRATQTPSKRVLTAFERAGGDLSDSRNRLRAELARLRLELPRGNVRLDRTARRSPTCRCAPTREGRQFQRGTRSASRGRSSSRSEASSRTPRPLGPAASRA